MDLLKKLTTGVVIFSLGMLAGTRGSRTSAVSASTRPELVAKLPALVVKLHRFKLKPDQLEEFDRWIAFEHAHHGETLATLEREHMYAESIFRDREHDPTTIYWAELRGAGGASVGNSPLPIDKVYEGFMQRTLVPGSHTMLQPEYTLVPPFLLESIAAHEAAGRGQ